MEVASYASTGGVSFWGQKEMAGCLFGKTTPVAGVKIEVSRFIADGGRNALTGHRLRRSGPAHIAD
jgi:hypothetical protein